MPKVRSGIIVTALTTAALAAIGVLAWQASAAPDHGGAPRASATAGSTAHHAAPPSVSAAAKALALPAASGTGKRVVYALARHRVWLVDATGKVVRTYQVAPGTVPPVPGAYAVTSRSPGIKGTDGVPVDDIVYFTVVRGTPVAFDYAADGSLPTPDPARKTGALRERIADGEAMWRFAPTATKVVVLP